MRICKMLSWPNSRFLLQAAFPRVFAMTSLGRPKGTFCSPCTKPIDLIYFASNLGHLQILSGVFSSSKNLCIFSISDPGLCAICSRLAFQERLLEVEFYSWILKRETDRIQKKGLLDRLTRKGGKRDFCKDQLHFLSLDPGFE